MTYGTACVTRSSRASTTRTPDIAAMLRTRPANTACDGFAKWTIGSVRVPVWTARHQTVQAQWALTTAGREQSGASGVGAACAGVTKTALRIAISRAVRVTLRSRWRIDRG